MFTQITAAGHRTAAGRLNTPGNTKDSRWCRKNWVQTTFSHDCHEATGTMHTVVEESLCVCWCYTGAVYSCLNFFLKSTILPLVTTMLHFQEALRNCDSIFKDSSPQNKHKLVGMYHFPSPFDFHSYLSILDFVMYVRRVRQSLLPGISGSVINSSLVWPPHSVCIT